MISEILDKNQLILDGGMGTMISKYNIDYTYPELLNLTHPNIIHDIHKKFILAGSDVIKTNTFNANLLTTKEKTYSATFKGVMIAKDTASIFNKKIYVAGAIGPTNMSLYVLSQDKNIDINLKKEELKKIYYPQIEAIIDAEPDFIIFETFYDSLNLGVALNVAFKLMKEKNKFYEIFISLTVDENGYILSHENLYDIIKKFDNPYIIGYGYNCSFGSEKLLKILKDIKINKKLIVYPNAGTPKNNIYPENALFWANNMKKIKADLIGGCCGVTPKYIKKLAK